MEYAIRLLCVEAEGFEAPVMNEDLRRVLRTPEMLFVGINAVVGGGIFLLPGQAAAQAGAASVWAYLAAGIVVA